MFLTIREIRHQPIRFGLVVAIIVLVAYLTFFLSSLAVGLAHLYRASIDHWDARSIIMTQEANKNVQASHLNDQQIDAIAQKADVTLVTIQPLVIEPETKAVITTESQYSDSSLTKGMSDLTNERQQISQEEKVNAYGFGLDLSSKLMPKISNGRTIVDPNSEVIVDQSLVAKGWNVGKKLIVGGIKHTWTIVGVVKDESFQAGPVLFFDAKSLLEDGPFSSSPTYNLAVSQKTLNLSGKKALENIGLETLEPADFVEEMPGYRAQVLTFAMMIGSLVIIASFVLGIFLYVLTLQKRPILGILKARGVPTQYLLFSGAMQTIVIAGIGIATGLGLVMLTGAFLPTEVPYRLNPYLTASIGIAFMVFSLFGGMISVRVVTKIDPVEAIA